MYRKELALSHCEYGSAARGEVTLQDFLKVEDATLIFIKHGGIKLCLFFSVCKSHLTVPGLSQASPLQMKQSLGV